MLLQLKCFCANVASLREWDENGKGQCTPLQNKRHVVFPLSPLFHQAHYLYSGSLNYCARCVQIGEDLTSLILHRCATLPFWLNRPGKSLVGSSLCNYCHSVPALPLIVLHAKFLSHCRSRVRWSGITFIDNKARTRSLEVISP